MNDNDYFIDLYNRLDNLLRDYYGLEDRNNSVIKRYEDDLKRSTISQIREKGFALETVRNVRNTLIHESKIYQNDAFLISKETLQFLKNEIDCISNPIKITDVMRKIEQTYKVTIDEPVKSVTANMSKKKFSHTPIIDNNGILVGVFSESTLYTYLLDHQEVSIKDSTTIKEFLDYIPVDKHSSEKYLFVAKNTRLSEIYNSFDKKFAHDKRIAMLFVTYNGKSNQKIIGIITLQDLLKSI